MDQRRLSYFLAVVDEGTVTEAAKRLRKFAPADLELLLDDLPAHEAATVDEWMGGPPAR